jgi:hypothetical protein
MGRENSTALVVARSQRCPSCTEMFDTASPPIRACGLPPVAITSPKAISSRRGVPQRHLRGAEMAADMGGVDVAERHHQARAGPTHGLRRRHDRLGLAQHLAHAAAAGLAPHGAVLEFAILATMMPSP